MFGYVLPLQGELKVKEFQYFKSYYCGLCHSLKDNFGNISRFTLNYDLTFISFIIDGLFSDELNAKNARCIKHFNRKIAVINSTDALNYAANLNIMLSNLKCKDNITDDNSIKIRIYSLYLSPLDNQASNKLSILSEIINSNMAQLDTLEKEGTFDTIDEICDPFSDTLGNILKLYPNKFEDDSETLRASLYDLGYSIGKWIYLIDALDDLKSDMENRKFNPYNVLYNKENLDFNSFIIEIIPDIEFIILATLSNCNEAMKTIPFKKHYTIIDNIINLGMMNQYYSVLAKIKETIEPKNSNSI